MNVRREPGAASEVDPSAAAALAALDRAPALALFVVDVQLRVRLAAGGLLTTPGWPGGSVVGEHVGDVIPAAAAPSLLRRYRAAVDGARRRLEHEDPGGRRYVVDIAPAGSALPQHATILWQEVTDQRLAAHDAIARRDRKLAERACDTVELERLDEEDVQARARTLLDSLAGAAILYDADGEVIARNEPSRELLGADDAALRLGTPTSVAGWAGADGAPLTPDRHPAVLARAAPRPVTTLVAIDRPDGTRPWARATACASSSDERPGEVALTLVDVTDLHEARLDLARSNVDLRQMALVASHDLAAPLAMLRRELAGIAADERSDTAADRLGRAIQAADGMQELLGAVLAYARVDRADIEREVVDLAAVAGEVRVILGEQLEASDAVLTIGKLPAIPGDRVLWRQLLQNLVSNAITHHPGPTPHVAVRALRRGDVSVLAVEDDGPGIPTAERADVFELFARGSSPTPGHGIGLATVKRIVELHGGRLWIEQAQPHGARVCVSLPEVLPPDGAPG